MDDSDRFKFGVLLPLLLGGGLWAGMLAVAISTKSWIPLALATLALVVLVGVLVAGRARNRWRGYQARAGERFEPSVAELPLAADHRGVVGAGRVENVLTGPGFTTFEVVKGLSRRWWFVVPLAQDHGHGHARVPLYHNGTGVPGRPPFTERYYVEGHIPGPMRQVLDEANLQVDLRVDGDGLLATTSGMSAARFPHWLGREGALVRRVAQALEPVADPDGPALDAGPRNLWQGPTAADPPRWEQPRPPATAAVRPVIPRRQR